MQEDAQATNQTDEGDLQTISTGDSVEEWRPIVGHEGRYEVSSRGRIRWVRVKTPYHEKNGYLTTLLASPGAIHQHALLHRQVAKAFLPNPDNLPVVNHIDNDRSNNRVENLEWTTYKGNSEHMVRQGRHRHGIAWRRKVTDIQVVNIRHMMDSVTSRQIAKLYGLTPTYVANLKRKMPDGTWFARNITTKSLSRFGVDLEKDLTNKYSRTSARVHE